MRQSYSRGKGRKNGNSVVVRKTGYYFDKFENELILKELRECERKLEKSIEDLFVLGYTIVTRPTKYDVFVTEKYLKNCN